ncbi:MAG: hypothetical protein ACT4PE_09265 [Candidatus Eiseniibacteriota bacterium]
MRPESTLAVVVCLPAIHESAAVATLLDGVAQAGRVDPSWDGRSSRGGRIASGVYFLEGP